MARRTAADVKAELERLQDEAAEEVNAAIQNLEEARSRVVTSVVAAIDSGLSYRQLAARTNRSREWFRSIVARRSVG